MSSPLPSILNFRDAGKTINVLTGTKLLQEGKLYRSARPDEASKNDRDRLINEFKIKTIIDLRTKTEHIEQAKKRDAKLAAAAAAPEALPIPDQDQVAEEPLKIPGITYRNINFNGKAYSNMLLSKLTWRQYLKLIFLMATGYRVQAIRIIGENVMREKGLIGLGTDSIDACTAEIKEFFEILADGKNYPIMEHCTQGKDRTGLTVLLVLLLLGVETETAEKDYMFSQKELVPEREERVKQINSIGLPDSFADCDPEFVREMAKHIQQKYGGIAEYLEHAGVSADMQRSVRDILKAT